MGWGFRVTCPDCGREWQDIQTSFRFGPCLSLEDPAIDDGSVLAPESGEEG